MLCIYLSVCAVVYFDDIPACKVQFSIIMMILDAERESKRREQISLQMDESLDVARLSECCRV